jgi:hypothetical protein
MTEAISPASNPFDPAFHPNCTSDAREPIIAAALMRTASCSKPIFGSQPRQTGKVGQ